MITHSCSIQKYYTGSKVYIARHFLNKSWKYNSSLLRMGLWKYTMDSCAIISKDKMTGKVVPSVFTKSLKLVISKNIYVWPQDIHDNHCSVPLCRCLY